MRRTLLYVIIILILPVMACNYFTYRPHNRYVMQRQKPSVGLLNSILDFRHDVQRWPYSKEDLVNGGPKFREAFEGFPYQTTLFDIIDSTTMNFYFSEHISDIKNYNRTGKVDLNSYNGRVKFYKKDGMLVWKLKMY